MHYKPLQGAVKLGIVNADDHGGLGSQYGVKGFPTIKVFGADKFKPSDYNGTFWSQPLIIICFVPSLLTLL